MMAKITKKINIILLIGLYLGGASKLYATQNDDVAEEKEDMADNPQLSPPNNANNQEGRVNMSEWLEWNDKQQVDWDADCKSIEECKALVTIMGCLQYWQKVTNDIGQLGQVFQYLSASNNYRDIVGAYHHVLDKHLNGKKNKEAFRFINGRLRKHIRCNFAKCKGYDRNQRDRGNEKAKKDEIDKYKEELVFIRDTLDTIHAYLVHGSDSGHRYSPSKYKRLKDDVNDDEKEPDKATYTLFDKEMASLKKWQKSIRQQGRNKTKNKFSTKVNEERKIDLALLKEKFGKEKTFLVWMHYIKDNECDTDCILEEIKMRNVGSATLIPIEQSLFDRIKKYIEEIPGDGKKTASYGFGVRLYYWDYYKNKEDEDRRYNRGHSYKDLYVTPSYLSFKNEILAKENISVSTWNQKMYAAKLILAQSGTLRKLKTKYEYGVHDIQKGAGVSIKHLLSIIFYTDFTALCTSFGESLRYLSPSESLQALIQRNSKWYHLSRYLREVVECFGTRISGYGYDKKGNYCYKDVHGIKGDTYYHGVSYLLFTQFSVHWYGPLSTSKQMEVATLFSNSTNNGLLLELKKDHYRLRFFNVSLLSCFGSEDERLFMGGAYPIHIATIRLLQDTINLKQIMHALFMVHSMLSGKKPGNNGKALPTDAAIYKDLCAPSTQIPRYAQDVWNAFRHNQQRITIDIENMYGYFQVFIPLLCDPQVKNLLLLDKIVQLFPNVTEIICSYTDCVGIKYNWWSWSRKYSAAIVSSNFILGVKKRLSKLDKHAKLTKILIKTLTNEIKDDSNLYAPQFGALGWQIGQGCDGGTIVVTKESYDVICKDVIPKIKSMLQGAALSNGIPPALDVPIFKKLILGDKGVPADVQKQWDSFRLQQQRITINMRYMYAYYKAFMPLLIDINCKNLLMFDKIAQLFPNVTEIICRGTNFYIDKTEKHGYFQSSSAIVSSNFILGVQESLSKLDKHVKLTKIVIQTAKHEVADDCNLYAKQFGALGWQVQRGSYKNKYGDAKKNNKITLTKAQHGNIWGAIIKEGVIPKIASLIAGISTDDSKLTSVSCMPIFKQLMGGSKDIPADAQKQWNAFRHQQQCITIDMKTMYGYFQVFMPLLFDMNCKNLLLVDKIVQLFPNVTKIICRDTDCIKGHEYSWKSECSAAIVCSNFILGVKERLSKLDKQAKLTKIVIQTDKHEIGDDVNLYPTQFGTLGWQLQKDGHPKQISLTKVSANDAKGDIFKNIVKEGVIPCISSLIAGLNYNGKLTSASCMPIFKQLMGGFKDIPADAQKQWNAFRHQQQCITIDMKTMYGYFQVFMPLLFDMNCKNLLLVDKIVQLFPNVTEIICRNTDWDDKATVDILGNPYSSDIVSSNFMLGLQERLNKLDKHAKLTKIVIQTKRKSIQDDCKLYPTQFGALGWKIEKGSYENKGGQHNQITITRLEAPNASSNYPPAKAYANEQKLNDYQSDDDEVFDID